MLTNSIIDNVYYVHSGSNSLEPVVGMGVTVCYYSERYAGTITRISKSGKSFWFKYDIVKRVDNNGMSDSQTYEYTENPEANEIPVRMNRKGIYKTLKSHNPIVLGVRNAFHKFSF